MALFFKVCPDALPDIIFLQCCIVSGSHILSLVKMGTGPGFLEWIEERAQYAGLHPHFAFFFGDKKRRTTYASTRTTHDRAPAH